MTSLRETDERWFNFEPIEGVRYGLNESVRVLKGVHKVMVASVIARTSLQPVTYLVGLSSGKGDIKVLESELECGDRAGLLGDEHRAAQGGEAFGDRVFVEVAGLLFVELARVQLGAPADAERGDVGRISGWKEVRTI